MNRTNPSRPLLRWGSALILAMLVLGSQPAAAEASQKTVCVVQDPLDPNDPLPAPVACAQAILTTTDAICSTDPSTQVYSCVVTAIMILTVSGPATCGRGWSGVTPFIEICTLATPARGQTPPQDTRFTNIPPGGREAQVEATVCAKLSFNDDSSYRCATWTHKIWLPGPVSADLENLLLEAEGYAGFVAAQTPDTEPVVVVGP